MFENVRSILSQRCRLQPDRLVVVGVSGGPDSLCLLDILHRSGYPLVAACLNHGLRSEANLEIEMVQQVAENMGVTFVSKTVDTNEFASSNGFSVEAAARQLRYDFLFAEAQRVNAQAIAVGHTADDQAETILLHLFRGAGLAGLKGMEFLSWLPAWSDVIPIIRPLLATWRNEVVDYCAQNHLAPVQDATNQSLDYFRNRLRHEVLPYLEQFQPHLRSHLVRMAGTLALDYELVQNQVEAVWNACMNQHGPGFVAFSRPAIQEQPVGIQRYLLRKAMLICRTGLQDIEMAMIERGRACLALPSGRTTCDLGAGLRLVVEPELAWVVARESTLPGGNWPATPADQVVELPVPGRLDLGHTWVLSADLYETVDAMPLAQAADRDPYQAWFDADALLLSLHVRSRQAGDRIHPRGMDGKTVKISDLMINLKLPYRSRATWPLVCMGDEIVWVPGCRVSCIARPTQKTQRLLNLKLTRLQVPADQS
jgi:tRNA(Ile)-lysidine synthase